MNRYTVKKEQNLIILQKDGSDCICPFQQPIPTQSNLGGMQLLRLPCSTQCPFATYSEYNLTDAKVLEYVTHCTGNEVNFDIQENTLKIIE
jgi:hypothetical protein